MVDPDDKPIRAETKKICEQLVFMIFIVNILQIFVQIVAVVVVVVLVHCSTDALIVLRLCLLFCRF